MSTAIEKKPGLMHDWTLTVVIPIEQVMVVQLKKNQRAVLKKIDVFDRKQVRASAVICTRCRKTPDKLGWGEMEVCRG